ncbi:hypothetical protein [Sorangium sp. So ce394]|uniref:hypothetical protein n=1 Tax=Sorangium sp. So ce394 TaxID=3133310 RepID=UPI003F5C0DA4
MKPLRSVALVLDRAYHGGVVRALGDALVLELVTYGVIIDERKDLLTLRAQPADVSTAAPEQVLYALHRPAVELSSERESVFSGIVGDACDKEVVEAELLLRTSLIFVQDHGERGHSPSRRVRMEAA